MISHLPPNYILKQLQWETSCWLLSFFFLAKTSKQITQQSSLGGAAISRLAAREKSHCKSYNYDTSLKMFSCHQPPFLGKLRINVFICQRPTSTCTGPSRVVCNLMSPGLQKTPNLCSWDFVAVVIATLDYIFLDDLLGRWKE